MFERTTRQAEAAQARCREGIRDWESEEAMYVALHLSH